MADIITDLHETFAGEIENAPETLEHYSRDTSLFAITPSVVVFPKDANDVQALVRYVSSRKDADPSLSITARSAGTDMTGGSLTTSIMVEMMRHLNHIVSIDEASESAIVEPGVFYRDFEKATLAKGLLLPSYTASKDICALGGMIANNSGGEKTLKYGKTARYVQELKMVCDDGELRSFGPVTGDALEQKLQLSGREGDIYRSMHHLLTTNYDLLQKHKPNVSKNSSGYALWDSWNPETGTLDLTQAIVGSQGTLGLWTEARLGLIKPKKYRKLLVLFVHDLAPLGDIVASVMKFSPDSFESYDDKTFGLAIKFFPEMAKRLKGNIFSLAIDFIPEVWMVLTGGVPKLVLLAEFTDDTEADALRRATECKAGINQLFPKVKTELIETDKEAEKFWVIRRESFALLRTKVRGRRTAPFIDDFVVRPEFMPEFLPKLNIILAKYEKKIIYTIAGHVGDGNFHIIPLMDMKDPETTSIIRSLSEEVYELVLSYGGSISGEHNDGLIRTPFVRKEYGEEVYALFEETKRIFDPKNIFNPGKKVNADIEYAFAHLDTKQS